MVARLFLTSSSISAQTRTFTKPPHLRSKTSSTVSSKSSASASSASSSYTASSAAVSLAAVTANEGMQLIGVSHHQQEVDVTNHPTSSNDEVTTRPSTDTTEKTDDEVATEGKEYKDVWYRLFLKPFAGSGVVSLYESYVRRRIQLQGIPIDQLDGIHEAFAPLYKYYSPLYGMIYNSNNFIDNLYKYGDSMRSPATQLVQSLFHIIPGGEIQTTHASSSTAAHFTPSMIGSIFELIEHVRKEPSSSTTSVQDLAIQIQELILNHNDYIEGIESIRNDIQRAQDNLQALNERETNAQHIRARIKHLEGDIIKVAQRKFKKFQTAQKKLKVSGGDLTVQQQYDDLEKQIQEQKHIMDTTQREVADLHTNIVTSADFKSARKAVKRAQDAVEYEQRDRTRLSNILAECFLRHDMNVSSLGTSSHYEGQHHQQHHSPDSTNHENTTDTDSESTSHQHISSTVPSSSSSVPLQDLPIFTTTSILQAFLWRKYTNIDCLVDYMYSMDRIGALVKPVEEVVANLQQFSKSGLATATVPVNAKDFNTTSKQGMSKPKKHTVNSSKRATSLKTDHDLEQAVTTTILKPNIDVGQSNTQIPIIPFSYITWAQYSEFPDCGETALRNFFNRILYTPSKQRFDYELLMELKEKYYPNLNTRLIEFYKQYSTAHDCCTPDVAKAWIETVSGLNTGRDRSNKNNIINYRREHQQQNIASPFSNLLRVINVLFGIDPITSNTAIVDVIQHINELRDDPAAKVAIDLSAVTTDGFGTVKLAAGRSHYELQSYRPVHITYKQVGGSNASSNQPTKPTSPTALHDYQVFQSLMRHSDGAAKTSSRRSKHHQQDTFLSASKKTSTGEDTASVDAVTLYEKLSIASLFVPYHIERKRVGSSYIPLSYMLYFGDLSNPSQQSTMIRNMQQYFEQEQKQRKVPMLRFPSSHSKKQHQQQQQLLLSSSFSFVNSIIERIRTYKEPIFQPMKYTVVDDSNE